MHQTIASASLATDVQSDAWILLASQSCYHSTLSVTPVCLSTLSWHSHADFFIAVADITYKTCLDFKYKKSFSLLWYCIHQASDSYLEIYTWSKYVCADNGSHLISALGLKWSNKRKELEHLRGRAISVYINNHFEKRLSAALKCLWQAQKNCGLIRS